MQIFSCVEHIRAMRTTRASDGVAPSIPKRRKRTINELTEQEAMDWTGFRKKDLPALLRHLKPPSDISLPHRCKASGEEALIVGLIHIRTGDTFKRMAEGQHIGGDARRLSLCVSVFRRFCL